MSPEANEAIVRRYWEAWNTGDVSIIDEVIAADYVFTDTAGRVLHGRVVVCDYLCPPRTGVSSHSRVDHR